ncbi:cupin domain-containing protein [Mesorhizobium sp. BR1-1-16]|uniref:cupin domain-containing protein n=1 Tax=Mesorhizobium sp. BR1-1-16 TaxID=2876653 RepID=UPI001CCFB760|nr:cupin domain-containing protein [Mesorhizobium sp. BR1-1-16]MBZ9939383.1 cupin domain-containing protein [Mesorhizobium sp. BR1-1-16]
MNVHISSGQAAKVDEVRFLGLPTWIKADRAKTGGSLSLVEQIIPPGFESPWHVHHSEDESFYVIDGTVTVIVGDTITTLQAGDFGFGPRGTPHGFRVEGSGPLRLLFLTTGGDFADFIAETSVPKDATPVPPDMAGFVAAAERHSISILGPLPR